MKRSRKVMLGVGVGMVFGVSLWLYLGSSNEDRIAERYSMPTSGEALKALVRVPEKENAYRRYVVFEKAYLAESGALKGVKEPSYGSVFGKNEFDPKKTEAYLSHFPKSIAAAKELGDGSKWFVDRDMSSPSRILLPEFAELKHAVKLLTLQAQVDLSKGDRTGALDLYAKAEKIGSFCNSEPFMIGILVYVACESIVTRSIANSATLIAPDPVATKQAEEILESIEKPNLALGMKGEEFLCYYSAKNGVTSDLLQDGDPFDIPQAGWNFITASLNATRNLWGPSILTHVGRAAESIEGNDYHRYEAEEALKEKWLDSPGLNSWVGGYLVPNFMRSGLASEGLMAKRDLTVLGLKSIASGQPPVAQGSNDPYIDKPFKILHLGNGWRVYSVGMDKADGGGKVDFSDSSKTKDIVFGYDGRRSFLIGL